MYVHVFTCMYMCLQVTVYFSTDMAHITHGSHSALKMANCPVWISHKNVRIVHYLVTFTHLSILHSLQTNLLNLTLGQ